MHFYLLQNLWFLWFIFRRRRVRVEAEDRELRAILTLTTQLSSPETIVTWFSYFVVGEMLNCSHTTIVTFEHFSVAQKLFQVQCSAFKFGFPWKYFCLNSCSNNKSQIVKKCLFNQEICICKNPKTNKHNILLMK